MNTNKLKKKKQKERKNVIFFPVGNIIFSVGVKIRQNFPENPIFGEDNIFYVSFDHKIFKKN